LENQNNKYICEFCKSEDVKVIDECITCPIIELKCNNCNETFMTIKHEYEEMGVDEETELLLKDGILNEEVKQGFRDIIDVFAEANPFLGKPLTGIQRDELMTDLLEMMKKDQNNENKVELQTRQTDNKQEDLS
jgi:hypothetical protein